ncbi:MAG: PaaI family thioesterase [Myxococcota bacterium]
MSALEAVRTWVLQSAYTRALGVSLLSLEPERARLALPYRDENSNGDKALHGGVAASLIVTGAHAVARASLGEGSGPWHTAAIQVGYLSAALGEAIRAEARLLRRGKELAHVEVSVETEQRKPVARGLLIVRGRFAAAEPKRPAVRGDEGAADLGPMGAFVSRVPFHARLGLVTEHMAGGRARIVMPWRDENADASGGVHEGALLGLLDTTGAMAAWAETGPGRFKASTPGIQTGVLAPLPRGDLVAYAHVRHRDREMLFSEVEIADAQAGLVARGTVSYRIVRPEPAP